MSRSSRDRWAARHDSASGMAQGYSQALSALDGGSGTSPRGAVTVDLGRRAVVARVQVASTWTQECTADELGALVVTTAATAQSEGVGRWAEATESPESLAATAQPIEEPAYRVREVSGRSGDFAVTDAIREVGGLTDAIDELVQSLTAVSAAHHRGRSSNRHATATVNGVSELVGLELDLEWLTTAHSTNIGREATQAIHEALRLASETTLESVVAGSRIGELRQRLLEPATSGPAPEATDPSADAHHDHDPRS